MESTVPRLFFSYSRDDTDFVLGLAKDLRHAGVNLWLDQLDIVPGERWDQAIEQALKASSSLLVVFSPDSVASQNVMDEVSFALEENKKVVPVLYRQCEVPFRLRRLQHVDFTGDYNIAFAKLLTAMQSAPAAVTEQGTSPAVVGNVAASAANRKTSSYLWVAVIFLLIGLAGYFLYPLLAPVPPKEEISSSTPTTVQEWELQGFNYLLAKDVDKAIQAFSTTMKLKSDYHNVYEIRKLLVANQEALRGKDSTKWSEVYKALLGPLKWGIPPEILKQLQENLL